ERRVRRVPGTFIVSPPHLFHVKLELLCLEQVVNLWLSEATKSRQARMQGLQVRSLKTLGTLTHKQSNCCTRLNLCVHKRATQTILFPSLFGPVDCRCRFPPLDNASASDGASTYDTQLYFYCQSCKITYYYYYCYYCHSVVSL